MNAVRRTKLIDITYRLYAVRESLNAIAQDERDAADNLEESFPDRAEIMADNATWIEDASEKCAGMIDDLGMIDGVDSGVYALLKQHGVEE